jgi:hypothetical protein
MEPDAADINPTGRQPNRSKKEVESAPFDAHSILAWAAGPGIRSPSIERCKCGGFGSHYQIWRVWKTVWRCANGHISGAEIDAAWSAALSALLAFIKRPWAYQPRLKSWPALRILRPHLEDGRALLGCDNRPS